MPTLIKLCLCTLTLCAFVLLAMYSLEYKQETLSEFSARKVAEYEHEKHWTNKQQQIAELWNITPEQAAKPIKLWRE